MANGLLNNPDIQQLIQLRSMGGLLAGPTATTQEMSASGNQFAQQALRQQEVQRRAQMEQEAVARQQQQGLLKQQQDQAEREREQQQREAAIASIKEQAPDLSAIADADPATALKILQKRMEPQKKESGSIDFTDFQKMSPAERQEYQAYKTVGKSAGTQLSVDPETGQVTFSQGGMAGQQAGIPLTKTEQSRVQKEQREKIDYLGELRRMGDSFRPEFQSLGSRAKAFGLDIMEYVAPGTINEEQTEFLKEAATHKSRVLSSMNSFINRLGGANVPPSEMRRLKAGLPNLDDSAPVFQAKLGDLVSQAEETIQRYGGYQVQGITAPPQEQAAPGSGLIVPPPGSTPSVETEPGAAPIFEGSTATMSDIDAELARRAAGATAEPQGLVAPPKKRISSRKSRRNKSGR